MKQETSHSLLKPWDRCVATNPDSSAVTEAATDRVWTFLEIDRLGWERAEAFEHQAQRLQGLPVIFRTPNGPEWIARFLALLRLGAPALPIDPSTPEAGAREIAARCGAAEWTDKGELRLPAKPRRYRAPAIALLKLTSGTSGDPKPIPFHADELAADGKQVMRGMGIDRRRRNFAIIPFGHSYGLGNLVVPLLLDGVEVVCGSSSFPHILAEDFSKARADVLAAVPAVFDGLVRAEVALPGLRLAITAGAPLSPALAQAFFNLAGQPLHNFFGSSETGGIAYDAVGDASLTGRSVGKPLPGVQVTLTSRGRIRVTSPAVYTRGNPRRSNGNGEMTVGDFGEWNEEGELVLNGRSGAMIKVGARRLDPTEIERALLQIAEVREAWVTGWSSGGEERPAAVVAGGLSSAELRSRLRRHLPAWKIPRTLVVLQRLPLTSRGKPDRPGLLRHLRQADDRQGEA